MQNLTLYFYNSTLFNYPLQSIACGLLAVAVAISSGCAVHYYD